MIFQKYRFPLTWPTQWAEKNLEVYMPSVPTYYLVYFACSAFWYYVVPSYYTYYFGVGMR